MASPDTAASMEAAIVSPDMTGELEDDLSDDGEETDYLDVPSVEEPFIQKYLSGRDRLIEQEHSRRSDYAFRSNLSPMAAEASAIVAAVRAEEQQTLWDPNHPSSLAKAGEEVYPGMPFTLAKERMERSKLWQIVKKMPKGALLHCHLEAMGDLDWLIEAALETEGMCITADRPITTLEDLDIVSIMFRYTKLGMRADAPSIWTSAYVANDPVPIKAAATSFSIPGLYNAGKPAFVAWIRSRCTITPAESLAHHLGPNNIWKKFLSCFSVLASLQHYEPLFRPFIRRMLSQLHSDGVRWLELRSVFLIPFTRANVEIPDAGFSYMLQCLQEEIDGFKGSEEGKDFWGARLIWTSARSLTTRLVAADMQTCISLKVQFPDLISGYDLVGHEEPGRPLADLVPELFWFRKQCSQADVEIPFFFHAGETLGDGTEADENLFDAVLLGTRRIGHGSSLYKHPLLIDMVKEKKILVESCPISSEVLRLSGSILHHPLPALLARGVPCSLSNDDPSILGQETAGVTHDFYQALQGWENLGLEGLGSLAENSIRWAAFEDVSAKEWAQEVKDGTFGRSVRAQRLKDWEKEFERFCQWVVLEFGAETELDGLD